MKPLERLDAAAYPDNAEGWMAFLLRDEPSIADREAFESWCAEDPAHEREIEDLSQVWSLAGTLDRDPEIRRSLRHSAKATTTTNRRWKIAAGLAAVLTLVLLSLDSWLDQGQDTTEYRTALGEQRRVLLKDGSMIELNTATTLRLSSAGDKAWLLAGEAFFDIQPRKRGRFEVLTGSGSVAVLGTRFNVWHQEAGMRVSVEEGSVAVDSSPRHQRDPGRLLRAGQSAEVKTGDGQILLTPATDDLARAQAWRDGLVELDRTPLSVVVRRLGRYTPMPLELTDPALGSLLVSGIFRIDRLGDLDSLRFALESSIPVSVQITEGKLRLLPAAPSAP